MVNVVQPWACCRLPDSVSILYPPVGRARNLLLYIFQVTWLNMTLTRVPTVFYKYYIPSMIRLTFFVLTRFDTTG